MEAQIRTWDKREEGTQDSVIVLPDEGASPASGESTIDRLELILQLREMQEPGDRQAANYAV